MGTALGTGAVENLGKAGSAAEGAGGGGEKGAVGRGATGGGEVMSERHRGSARVVAERGTITVGRKAMGADIGVGVENRFIS